MKNMKNLLLVGLLIGQSLFASRESVFTTAGKNMVNTEVLVGVGSIAAIPKYICDKNGYAADSHVSTACELGGYGTVGAGLLLRGLPDVRKIDKGVIKASVGETGEALAWSGTAIGICTPIVHSVAARSGIPLNWQASTAICTGTYAAFVAAAAFESDANSK